MAATPERTAARLERYAEAVKIAENGSAPPHLKEIVALLRQGLDGVQAARHLGLARSTVYGLLDDPKGEKTYRRKHSGECEACGQSIYSANPGAGFPMRFCRDCAGEGYTFWTRQTIIEAIREYDGRYGRPPGAMDWNVPLARAKAHKERLAEIEARWDEGLWPITGTVQRVFGSWNAAIRTAGFAPLTSGQRRDPMRWRRNKRSAA